ncbi:protein Mis18-alpha-like isoform X2 [Peromyscus maniculatus bairdii]|uniref:protein Mis18-alpha-like isoform X2 n=1 Tax=Peromyscus maniculatus bairdii TaxID=230844 RepID=UPI003FD6093A
MPSCAFSRGALGRAADLSFMAASCSLGCSSASCVCSRRGTRGHPSLLEKRLSEDSRRHRLLQKWASMWSAEAAEAEPEPCVEKAAAAADPEPGEEKAAAARENPLVFLCSRCRRPLGDSLTWVTSQEDSNCILLRCVSSNVSVDKEQKLSTCKGEEGCYTLGSSKKQIVSEDKELLNLESRVEMEKSIKQMEDVLKALLTKLLEIESKLSSAGCCV